MTTEEEIQDIMLHIILPMLLNLIDKWAWFPEPTPLKHLHQSQFQELLDMLTLDHIEAKQRLKAANIKVVKIDKFSPTLDYKIYVRRYEENLSFWKGHIKSEMSKALGKYVSRLDRSKFKAQPVAAAVKNETVKDQSLYVNFD